MEQLSLLQKIYLYGETLSSEELNQIVLYLNSSIEAINTLIARNNNINEGHCEMRYKVSAQLPEAPESGTDGKSNGWSDTYTKPDTANGEITWMTLSFFNGEGVYGAWSTPVCITWGSIRGQVGPKGDSGLKGSFKSRIFKRLNSRPDTPTGGTYDNPIPSEGGWTDGIPSGAAIIWSSVCTFYGNGLSSGWSVPAPESDSDTLDIEFSPNVVQPEPPTGETPFTDHESEGWYDPSSNQFNVVGTMIWRAERKVSNGEYNGDWTITRIVGERGPKGESGLTGGHYEFRYNNFTPSAQASAPTKPSDGSNGTTGGWTASLVTLTEQQIKNGTATWMTQCYQNENGTYGTWTDPIRITGANGYDGADGNEIEFVYTRRNTAWNNPTPPDTTQRDDWTGTDSHNVVWTDNPQGVTENMMYEYVSLRAKINDVWSAYSTPVVWSKWGEKGMDGDGYEYIYKRFSTTITWADANTDSSGSTLGKNDNPANWSTSASGYLNKEYIYSDSGWSDDPVGINETYKYEYVSTREYRLWPNETEKRWGAFSTPTLWSGIPGGKEEFRYANTNSASAPTKPTAGTSGLDSTWAATQTTLTDALIKAGYKTYMTHCFKTDTGTYGTWSDPVRITGKDGEDGADGSDVEFIYKRQASATPPSAPTSVNTDDYVPEGWTDNPSGVTSSEKYEFVAVREKPAGNNQSWGAYHVALWSKWGEKGMDGDGYEYIFKLSSTKITSWSTDPNDYSNPANWPVTDIREYYGPYSGNELSLSDFRWSDDPLEVDSTNKYLYMSTRQRVDGHWLAFTTPVLWNNYAEAGATVQGPPGDIGPMSYLAGIWDATTTYTKTSKLNPVVYYADNDSYYYLAEEGSSIGDNPVTSNPNPWLQAENYNMVFTDILFVNDFAKLGSFIVNLDWMISQYGIIYDSSRTAHDINSDSASWTNSGITYVGKVSTSGLQPAYSLFDPYHPNIATAGATPGSTPNFVPYAAINAKTGETYFAHAHVTGEINATGGVFSGDVYANAFRAGNINGFNITVESDSINFNYGSSKQAWFSTKKLEMDSSGNIVDSGNDAPLGFYLYMISPKNGNVVTIDFDNLSFSEVVNNAVLVPVHTNTSLVKRITASSSGRASISNTTIYYKNKDSLGNTITTQYYWDSECTNLITGALGAGYYVVVKTGYVVVNETVVLGGPPYVLRPVTIYLPATYISNAGIITGSGDKVYIIDRSSNNTDLVFVTGTSSVSTLYNSGVYYANTGTTLNNMTGPLQIASGSSSVSTYAANKSAGSTIPTPSGTLSVFTATGSSPMTKADYSS